MNRRVSKASQPAGTLLEVFRGTGAPGVKPGGLTRMFRRGTRPGSELKQGPPSQEPLSACVVAINYRTVRQMYVSAVQMPWWLGVSLRGGHRAEVVVSGYETGAEGWGV